ncbi:MAG: hypothetical protein ACKVU2_12085, partial [Saprospiraceae bacterium]
MKIQLPTFPQLAFFGSSWLRVFKNCCLVLALLFLLPGRGTAATPGIASVSIPPLDELCVAYCDGTYLTLSYNETYSGYYDDAEEVALYFVSWETPNFWVLRKDYEYFYVYETTSPDPAGTYVYYEGGSNYPCPVSVTVSTGACCVPPTAFDVTGGGAYYSGGTGVTVGLNNSETGVDYQLQNNGSSVGSAVAGTGSAIDFGNQTAAGTYTVVATATTGGCTAEMTGSASVTIIPANLCVSFCDGTDLALRYEPSVGGYASNTSNVNLYFVSWNDPTFWVLESGNYAFAYYTASPDPTGTYDFFYGDYPCTGPVTVAAGASTAFAVTGSGTFCGGSGISVEIGLNGSQVGMNYQLRLNGVDEGNPLSGTGSALSFGYKTMAGTYTVVVVPTEGCTAEMTGSVTVGPPTVFDVTGGLYCALTASESEIALSDSEPGVSYQLKQDGNDIGDPIAGFGDAFSFGYFTEGTFTVLATNVSSGCTATMNGSVEAGPSNYCVGNLSLENETDCLSGQNTTCISDDIWTADIVVSFGEVPPTGELVVSSDKFVNGLISIPVSELSGTSHTIVGVEFFADGTDAFSIESGFTINGNLVYSSNFNGKSSCSNPDFSGQSVVVSDMTGSCGSFGNGTYHVYDIVNGAPAFTTVNFGTNTFLRWTGSEWEIHHIFFARLASAPGTPEQVPCSGWTALTPTPDCGTPPTLTGNCDVPLFLSSCDITQIEVANVGDCNNSGTTDESDDTFTADVTVTFAYAPTGAILILKRNGTAIASSLSLTSNVSLHCVTSWTFYGVEMTADGEAYNLTAEFSSDCNYAETGLGNAPASCSCALNTETCNGVDDNCDGNIDEGFVYPTVFNITGGGAVCSENPVSVYLLMSGVEAIQYDLLLDGSPHSTFYGSSNGNEVSVVMPGTYTVVAINASGCTVLMSGSATVTETDYCIQGIEQTNRQCDGQNTSCSEDDIYTADVIVQFASGIPPTGTLDVDFVSID